MDHFREDWSVVVGLVAELSDDCVEAIGEGYVVFGWSRVSV